MVDIANDESLQQDAIAKFCVSTGADPSVAREMLQVHAWDVDKAINSLYSDGESDLEPPAPSAAPASEPASTAASSSHKSKAKDGKKRGFFTFSSLSKGPGHADHDDDDDDEDGDESSRRRNLFAGGEKSGLAVQDPSQRDDEPANLINDILKRARQGLSSRDSEPSSPRSRFVGTGQTLGGDGVESVPIPDTSVPRASALGRAKDDKNVQQRTIHLWSNGFSIDEGPLHSFSDPENREVLRLIREGKAPLRLLNVRLDQPVDVHLAQHPEEEWRQLPRKYKPFSGEGRRLGSPVPSDGNPSPSAASASAATASSSTTSTASATGTLEQPTTGADLSQPTINIRVQLPTGARISPARFNPTQTLGDLYSFVSRLDTALQARSFVIATFPMKEHTDRGLVLGEMDEFKRGGNAIVKWA